MSSKHEVRSFTAAQPFSVRTTADGRKQVSGYAIVFNSPSQDLGGFAEICSPQMLNRTLKQNPDVLMLRDHKQELLLGRTTAGTLDLLVDSTGLAFTVTLPQTTIGDDTYQNVRLRNLTGCSFGFNVVEDSWAVDSNGNVVRTLLDIDLFECSITSFPAYVQTSVSARSKAAALAQRDDDDDDVDDVDGLDCDGDDADDPCCVDEDGDECRDQRREDSLRVRTLFAHRMNADSAL